MKAILFDLKICTSMNVYSFETFLLVSLKADFTQTDKFKIQIEPFLHERKQKGFFLVPQSWYLKFYGIVFKNDKNLKTCHSFQLLSNEFLDVRKDYEESDLLTDLNKAIEDFKPREVRMCFNFANKEIRLDFENDKVLADKIQFIRGSTWSQRIFHLGIPGDRNVNFLYLGYVFETLRELNYKAFY